MTFSNSYDGITLVLYLVTDFKLGDKSMRGRSSVMLKLTNGQNADKLLGADDADKLLLTASHIIGVVCCFIILSRLGDF